MKPHIFTALFIVSLISFAFCAGESHVPPKNPGQDTTGAGAGYGGSGAAQTSGAVHPIVLGITGGVSFPVSDLHRRYSTGWNVGTYALFGAFPNISFGPSFTFNRFSPRDNAFLFFTPAGVPVGGGEVDGFSWLTDLEVVGRLGLPIKSDLIATFVQVGAGWFHFKEDVTRNVPGALAIESNLDGFASSYGLGVSFLVHRLLAIDILPIFHFDLSDRPPIDYFTLNASVSTTF
jgi:hypothetical protein